MALSKKKKINFDYKAWLQDMIGHYGINLEGWIVELVPESRPSNYPGHLPYSGQCILATRIDDNSLEIAVEDVWVGDNGEILQHAKITLMGR